MQAVELPVELRARFKASVHHKPADRAFTREWLASAMAGVPVEVVEGFTKIKPMPERIEPKGAAKKQHSERRSHVRPAMLTEDVIATVGGDAALANYLGMTQRSVSNWSLQVPSHHELKVRELLRNWRKINRAEALFAVGLPATRIAAQLDIPTEELFDLITRFNLNTNE